LLAWQSKEFLSGKDVLGNWKFEGDRRQSVALTNSKRVRDGTTLS
jgi:hypothetical protein